MVSRELIRSQGGPALTETLRYLAARTVASLLVLITGAYDLLGGSMALSAPTLLSSPVRSRAAFGPVPADCLVSRRILFGSSDAGPDGSGRRPGNRSRALCVCTESEAVVARIRTSRWSQPVHGGVRP